MPRETTDTPRLGLARPEILDDWAEAWDTLVELIDEDLVQTGTTANRPSSGNYDDELYLDYEGKTLYRWDADASSWETAIDGSTGYTDEDAQDAVGAALSGDFNYDDANNAIDIGPHADDSTAHHSDIVWYDSGSEVGSGQYSVDIGDGLTVSADTFSSVEIEATGSEYTDADAIAAIEAEDPLDLAGVVNLNGADHTLSPISYPLNIQANGNRAIAIFGDSENEEKGEVNWFHSSGNYLATVGGDGDGDHLSIYVADVADVSNSAGNQKKAMDLQTGPGPTDIEIPNLNHLKLWNHGDDSANINLDIYGNANGNAMLRWFADTGASPGTGTLSYALYQDGNGDIGFYDYTAGQQLFGYDGSAVNFPTGLQSDGATVATENYVDSNTGSGFSGSHNDLSDVATDDHHSKTGASTGLQDDAGDLAVNTVAQSTIQLSEGSATVSTGVTTTGTNLDVYLDPSGDGANSATVGASARAVWNNSAGEYEIEILEDGTDVGNPTIGYRVVRA